ncbi:MAG: SRPBCC family protein [Acidobacteriota bacterium]
MGCFETRVRIAAPRPRVFDLARSVELHLESTSKTRERAVGGVVSGLLGAGEEVTWSARHFGIRQRLTSRITRFDPPRYFRDEMVAGAFSHFHHDHHFEALKFGTMMRDVLDFEAPLGWLGKAVDRLVLIAYLRRFIESRGEVIRRIAESDAWQEFLPEHEGGSQKSAARIQPSS